MNKTTVSEQTKETYRRLLEGYRDSGSKEGIANRSPWQAQLAVRSLAQLAVKRQAAGTLAAVRILTSTLPEFVYGGETAQTLGRFRDAGGDVRVVVWNDSVPVTDDPFWREIINDNESCQLSETTEGGDKLNHFCLVGEDAYRLEAPHSRHSCGPDGFCPARICFSDEKIGKQIAQYFDALWQHLKGRVIADTSV